ncbi:MAG TPA: hypothetical protein VM889_12760 [Candidatus Thermoplasmatota archaeon]|nr:hypothetical protein [Candidatus Thermoplasmatota archaeon]
MTDEEASNGDRSPARRVPVDRPTPALSPKAVIKRIVGVERRHLVALAALFALAALLTSVPALALAPAGAPAADPGSVLERAIANFAGGVVILVVSVVVNGVAYVAGAVLAWRALRGVPPTDLGTEVATALGQGMRRAGDAIVALFLVGVAVALGLVLLVVPGIILAVAFSVVFPVLALEGLGAVESIRRSLDLTRGNRMKLFLVFLALAVAHAGVALLAGIVSLAAGPAAEFFATVITAAVMMPFWVLAATLVYGRLAGVARGTGFEPTPGVVPV